MSCFWASTKNYFCLFSFNLWPLTQSLECGQTFGAPRSFYAPPSLRKGRTLLSMVMNKKELAYENQPRESTHLRWRRNAKWKCIRTEFYQAYWEKKMLQNNDVAYWFPTIKCLRPLTARLTCDFNFSWVKISKANCLLPSKQSFNKSVNNSIRRDVKSFVNFAKPEREKISYLLVLLKVRGSRLFGATISAPPISLPVLFSTDRFVANSVLFDSSVI